MPQIPPYGVVRDDTRDLAWFIDNVLVGDIKKVIDAGAGYLAFGLIAEGVEFLGALMDDAEFHEKNLSEKRFQSGIHQFFPTTYTKYNRKPANDADRRIFLYEELRCGMAHVLRPKPRLGFTGRADGKAAQHLQLVRDGDTEILVLVLDAFFDDFVEACRKAKNQLKQRRHPKLSAGYLTIYTEPPPSEHANLGSMLSDRNTAESASSLKLNVPITGAQFPPSPPTSSVD